MADEKKTDTAVEETVSMEAYKALVEKLSEMQNKTIPADEHQKTVERMRKENETLLKGLAEGRQFKTAEVVVDKEAELKKVTAKLQSEEFKDDVDMIETHLRQRELMIEVMGIDPMVGLTPKSGNQAVITPQKAQQIADGLQELVTYAKENNISFQKANDIKKIVDHNDIRVNNKKRK